MSSAALDITLKDAEPDSIVVFCSQLVLPLLDRLEKGLGACDQHPPLCSLVPHSLSELGKQFARREPVLTI